MSGSNAHENDENDRDADSEDVELYYNDEYYNSWGSSRSPSSRFGTRKTGRLTDNGDLLDSASFQFINNNGAESSSSSSNRIRKSGEGTAATLIGSRSMSGAYVDSSESD